MTVQHAGTKSSSPLMQNWPMLHLFDWFSRESFSLQWNNLCKLCCLFLYAVSMYWVHRWTSSCKEIWRSLRQINKMYLTFFFSPQQLFGKLGRKQWPGRKALWSDKIKKKCTSYKSTNQHQSSSVTRKNKLLPACLPSHIFLCVTRSRWDKAPSVLASSNAGVKASPSLKER